jgi:hypothetical protein
LNSYKIRIIRPGKPNINQVLKAKNFNTAYARAGKRFKSWIDQGFDVQVYNPGEKTAIPQNKWKGEV